MNKETRNAILKHIENHEYYNNGLKHVNGACVDVENLEVDEEENIVRCTVTLNYQMDGKQERFSNCEYPLEQILHGIKQKEIEI